jgi:hypothetical protein
LIISSENNNPKTNQDKDGFRLLAAERFYHFLNRIMTYKKSVLKNIFFLVLITLFVKGSAQNSDHLISMNGIGTIKIGMSQNEIEKILNQKFTLRNALDTAESWQDSATAKYKNINVLLFFQRQYTADTTFFMYLIGIKTSGTYFRTSGGVGIGADKLKIIAAYAADNICMGPEFKDESDPIKSKTNYLVSVRNESGEREIVFYLRNKKVVAIEVNTIFNDEE